MLLAAAAITEKRGLPTPATTAVPVPLVLDASNPERRMAACEAVVDICAVVFSVSGRELRAPSRSEQSIARVRQIAMYLCHVTLSITLTEVGRGFGRDRTTVAHAVQTVEQLRDEPDFDCLIGRLEEITRALQGGTHG